MKISRIIAFAGLLAVALLSGFRVPAAQVSTAHEPGSTTSAPVVVRQTSPKEAWLKAEVIHADRNSIVVRERANPLFIHTFTYGPRVKTTMENMADQGATFQTGDIVKIRYLPGQTVALRIHGKPSK